MPRAPLPAPRGELTGFLFERLRRPVHALPARNGLSGLDSVGEDDLHLALYCMYELHYRGFEGVSDDWEWEPSLLGLRRRLEAVFESELRASVGEVRVGPAGAVAELWSLAG